MSFWDGVNFALPPTTIMGYIGYRLPIILVSILFSIFPILSHIIELAHSMAQAGSGRQLLPDGAGPALVSAIVRKARLTWEFPKIRGPNNKD